MESKVTEIARDVYRISTFNPDFGIQFNQFLIKDDEPFIMHTGMKKRFPITREPVDTVIEPVKCAQVGAGGSSWHAQYGGVVYPR